MWESRSQALGCLFLIFTVKENMTQVDFFESSAKNFDEDIVYKRISVLVPVPVDQCYTYAVPEDEHVALGSYVRVSVGAKSLIGVVWDDVADESFDIKKVKPIDDVLDVKPLSADHRQFIDRMARYTMSPRGAILKMTLSTPAGLQPPKTQTAYTLIEGKRGSTSKREAVIEVLRQHGQAMKPKALATRAKTSPSTLKAMVVDGELEQISLAEAPPCVHPKMNDAKGDIKLSEDQTDAAQSMIEALNDGAFKTLVLDGVTGSGKTEVYFAAVERALALGKQVLILLPEIALSNAFFDRFQKRFGCPPALWHSSITQAQRRKTWRGVAEGQTKVVIGARSALFLPFQDLGFVVVDEEHDTAYKQEDGVMYHARDMAVMRCFVQKCPIVLVSATPSLETVLNLSEGRYEHLVLASRYGGAELPSMHIVDMKAEKIPKTEFISPTLRMAMAETIAKGQQAFLFLNRRGYAPLTLCRSCGHRYECPQCTAWLVMHTNKSGRGGKLQCHHCGYSSHYNDDCVSCGATDSLVPCGPGVERIAEEVKQVMPTARSIVLASDAAENSEDFFTSLERIRQGDVDIVIGTQIMAKGHHFPNLTCVGIIDADLGLKGGDLRAGEHTWQLLHQVAGRAGRGEHEGHVYIQTYSPESSFINALVEDDRQHFVSMELRERKQAEMPPFSRLVAVILSCEDEKMLIEFAQYMARHIPPHSDRVQFYGPAPAPLYMLRGRYRARFLIQAHKQEDVQTLMREWLNLTKKKKSSKLRVQIDIDPQSFF